MRNKGIFITGQANSNIAGKEKIIGIDEALQSFTNEDYDEVYSKLARADVPSYTDIPIYRIIQRGLFFHGPSDISLINQVLFYKYLEKIVENTNSNYIRTGDIDQQYSLVAKDLSNRYGLEYIGEGKEKSSSRYISYMAILVSLVPFIADQILSQFLRPFIKRTKKDIVFCPGRIENFSPVLDEFRCQDTSFIVTRRKKTISYIFRYLAGEYTEDWVPINVYSSIKSILSEICFLLGPLRREFLVEKETEKNLDGFLKEDLDVEMPKTVSYDLSKAFTPNLVLNIVQVFIYTAAFKRLSSRSVVIGGAGTFGESILLSAEKNSMTKFHIPHSIIAQYWPVPKDTYQFIENREAKSYLKEKGYIKNTDYLIPTGRPYLQEMFRDFGGKASYSMDKKTILLVATQPFDDHTRRTFIEDVLSAAKGFRGRLEVIIKTHPAEDPSFYEPINDQFKTNISIKNSNLFENIDKSDVVITINSNVGIEAIIFGTPCICYNKWSPRIRDKPYAEMNEGIPVLRSSGEVKDYFSSFNADQLELLKDQQIEIIRDKYICAENSAKHIAEFIQDASE